MSIVKETIGVDPVHERVDYCLSKDVQAALADSPINRNVGSTPEAVGTLTWGKAQIGSLDFMKTEVVVVCEHAGRVRQWHRMIAL